MSAPLARARRAVRRAWRAVLAFSSRNAFEAISAGLSVLGVVVFQHALGALLRVPVAIWRTERTERMARTARRRALAAIAPAAREHLLDVPQVGHPLEDRRGLTVNDLRRQLRNNDPRFNPHQWGQLSGGLRAQAQAFSAIAGPHIAELPSSLRETVSRAISSTERGSEIAWSIERNTSEAIAQQIEGNMQVLNQVRETRSQLRGKLADALDDVAAAVAALEDAAETTSNGVSS
jgi:hypothetical protein